ncbi:hypothetical protein E2C01_097078 [Portunus trituberculatus]|uniref:Uncharacterized protein n=1 Tax=Portunus trituberculatus TaxID=210409 RepID=A0A5B7K4R2_PORTR|nr:hypothetical protein [Portunus trituberculatus]
MAGKKCGCVAGNLAVSVQVSMWVSDKRRQVAWWYCVPGKGSQTSSVMMKREVPRQTRQGSCFTYQRCERVRQGRSPKHFCAAPPLHSQGSN